MARRILFLSALDFKEKSIQVIRKTPEAYVADGWDVTYLVGRDNSSYGNYAYEDAFDPPGVKVRRVNWPLTRLRNATSKSRILNLLITKAAAWFLILKLAFMAYRVIADEKPGIIYGYEFHGVLAVRLLKLFGGLRGAKTVSRFQGTWLYEMYENKQYARLLWNADALVALRAKADLVIMTNDGTRGDLLLNRLGVPEYKTRFWVNGVDKPRPTRTREELLKSLGISGDAKILLSVSRLEKWKRLDRGLNIAKSLKSRNVNFKYIIIGDGAHSKYYQNMSAEVGVSENVLFTGAIKNEDVLNYYSICDAFISMYDLSNVGNPLLEAIRSNAIIVTLNNGDTRRWITHMENGLIYDHQNINYDIISNDLEMVFEIQPIREKLHDSVRLLENGKLWTWSERFAAEVKDVSTIISTE